MYGLNRIGLVSWLALASSLGGCEEDPSRFGTATNLCEALQGYVSSCGPLSACEGALVRDCSALELALSPSFATAATDCLNGLGTPMDCIGDAVRQTPSSSGLQALARTVCLCSDGAGGACEDDFLTGADSDAGRAGRIARMLDDSVLQDVDAECTAGERCTETFEDCAFTVMSRTVPGETADCLIDAVLGRFSDDCAAGDTDDGDGGGSDGKGDPSDPSDPGSDTSDPDEPDEPGACTGSGCACMFHEDCADGFDCIDDVCSARTECPADPNEPNNGEIQATFLPPITDSDGDGSSINGVLENAFDIDWFRYEGSDVVGALVNPYAQLNVYALELCIYAECMNGLENTDISCPEGTTQRPSPSGRPGCCATNTSGFEISLGCGSAWNPFTDESSYIYMSVTGSEPNVCQDFTLSYHF
jgi:hypothetical protein